MLRRILKVLFLLLVIALIVWSDLVIYGLRQLRGQLHIVNNAVEITSVIDNSSTPDSIRNKLLFIGKVRKFAVDSLGLNNSDNYTTYFDQQGKPAVWVITACEPFALKAYEWWFPFLGHVSYKGFFKKELGYPEVQRLQRLGYDVEYSPAGGWSTLGWFRDPVLSGMLRRNKGQLAELIIHELTHATVYKKGQVEFNENLATFVGEQGATQFLSSTYGTNSSEVTNYKNELENEQLFGEFTVSACKELTSFYDSLPADLPVKEKHLARYRKIAAIVLQINKLPLHRPESYTFKLPEDKLPDNTWFMGYQRYRGNQDELNRLYLKNSNNLRSLIHSVE